MQIQTIIWLTATFVSISVLYLVAISALTSFAWKNRKLIMQLTAGLAIAALPFIFVTNFPVPLQLLFSTLQLLIILLCARIITDRLHGDFLRSSTIFNGGVALLIGFSLLTGWLFIGITDTASSLIAFLETMTVVSVAVGVGFIAQILWTLKHYRLRKIDHTLTQKELPTVTLAIPARNETHALTDCLQAAVNSDYPKLEIIVLDDCSQDKTSQIIRSFATVGVRFVKGDVPADTWIGKTNAYQTLAEHASGEFIVFTSVDTVLSSQSISKLIAYTVSNKVDMVSVLPQRESQHLLSNIPQQLQYFWQIALPITKRRVPVASSCWVIKRATLKHLGSFKAVRHKIMPEGSFARRLFQNDMYRFLISNKDLGITNGKRWSSQLETSLRILYPTLKRQPVLAMLAMWFLLLILITPFVNTLILGILGTHSFLFWTSALAVVAFYTAYLLVVARTTPWVWPFTVLLLPFIILQETVLVLASLLAYEFSEVNWKGRNVCYPVITYKK